MAELTINFLVLEAERFGVKSYEKKNARGRYEGTNYSIDIGDNEYTGQDYNLKENITSLIKSKLDNLELGKTDESDYNTIFYENHFAIIEHLGIEKEIGDLTLEYFSLDSDEPNSYAKHLTKSIEDQIKHYEKILNDYWIVRRDVQVTKREGSNKSIKISVGVLLSGTRSRPIWLRGETKFSGRVIIYREQGKIIFVVDSDYYQEYLDNYSIKLIPEKRRKNGSIQVAVAVLFSRSNRFIHNPQMLLQDIIIGDFMICDNLLHLELKE